VVLGAGINGLGVARSLARVGVPVWLLDTNDRRAEMQTRSAKPVKVRALHGEALIEDLVRLRETQFAGSRTVLLLTQENTVQTISRQRDRLSDLYRFVLPPSEMVATLQHKHGFQRLAEAWGAPIPALLHLAKPTDLPALENLRYPVVVKPGMRHAEYSRRFHKSYRVENAADAMGLLRRILAVMSDVVVQEWIEGPDSNLHFCLQYRDRQGRVAASFTGRKIRSWPPQVGGTASCTPAPEAHRELSRLTTRFFQQAGVIGMASMEFKRDSRSGKFQMVEPTIGRTDYQEEVATLNGVNLPYAAYCAELGHAFPEPSTARRATVWRVRSEDAQSAALQGEHARQGLPAGCRVADVLWRVDDPRPFLVQNLRHIRRALRTRTSRIVPRPHAPSSSS
jgi:predicted ATP-grasp superfamily ATP-dependent carboligase